jgi:hypothetical protein
MFGVVFHYICSTTGQCLGLLGAALLVMGVYYGIDVQQYSVLSLAWDTSRGGTVEYSTGTPTLFVPRRAPSAPKRTFPRALRLLSGFIRALTLCAFARAQRRHAFRTTSTCPRACRRHCRRFPGVRITRISAAKFSNSGTHCAALRRGLAVLDEVLPSTRGTARVLHCTAAAAWPRAFFVRRCVRVRRRGQQRVPGGLRADRDRGGVPHRGRRRGQDVFSRANRPCLPAGLLPPHQLERCVLQHARGRRRFP